MIPKPLAWLLVLTTLALFGCATAIAIPTVPSGAELVRDEPILCPDRVLYLHVYDVNPATEALVATIGPTNEQHAHGAPFIVVVSDDAGIPTFYVSIEGQKASKLTKAEFEARYGPMSAESVCGIAASVRASAS